MNLTLYYSPGACSMAAHILLEETGAPYEAVKVDLAKGENLTPEFTAINPRRQVPVLKAGDFVLTEDIAILLYLARIHPEQRFISADHNHYAHTVEWLSFFATTIHATYTELIHPDRHSADISCAGAVRGRARERLAVYFADVESHFAGPYLVGDSFSIADAHLFVLQLWGRRSRLVSAEKTPKLFAFGERLKQRPSVWRVLEKEGISP